MNRVKRHKEINRFSNDIDIAISKIKSLNVGMYSRNIIQVNNIHDVVAFIDSNTFIKETIGKGVRLLDEFNYGYIGIEIYDYYKKRDLINKTIEELDI